MLANFTLSGEWSPCIKIVIYETMKSSYWPEISQHVEIMQIVENILGMSDEKRWQKL